MSYVVPLPPAWQIYSAHRVRCLILTSRRRISSRIRVRLTQTKLCRGIEYGNDLLECSLLICSWVYRISRGELQRTLPIQECRREMFPASKAIGWSLRKCHPAYGRSRVWEICKRPSRINAAWVTFGSWPRFDLYLSHRLCWPLDESSLNGHRFSGEHIRATEVVSKLGKGKSQPPKLWTCIQMPDIPWTSRDYKADPLADSHQPCSCWDSCISWTLGAVILSKSLFIVLQQSMIFS